MMPCLDCWSDLWFYAIYGNTIVERIYVEDGICYQTKRDISTADEIMSAKERTRNDEIEVLTSIIGNLEVAYPTNRFKGVQEARGCV